MSSPEPLGHAEVDARLAELSPWVRSGDRIVAQWRFADFATAFGFMTTVAIECEKRNHHPEWSNVYNRVTVELTTHDVGGLSSLDLELAAVIGRVAARSGGEAQS